MEDTLGVVEGKRDKIETVDFFKEGIMGLRGSARDWRRRGRSKE